MTLKQMLSLGLGIAAVAAVLFLFAGSPVLESDRQACLRAAANIKTVDEALAVGNQYVPASSTVALDCAVAAYQRGLELDTGENPEIWYRAGVANYLQGDLSAAVYKLQQQLALHGDAVTEAHYYLGLSYRYRAGQTDTSTDWQKAEEALLTYAALRPESVPAFVNSGWALIMQQRFADAARQLTNGLAHHPEHPALLNLRSIALLRSGAADALAVPAVSGDVPGAWGPYPGSPITAYADEQLARACVAKVRSSGSASQLYAVAQDHFESGNYHLWCAERAFEKAILVDPFLESPLWHQLGRVYFIQGKYGSALTALQTQHAITGDGHVPVFYMLGLTHAFLALDHGRFEYWPAAEIYFKQYLRHMPESPWAHTDLAWTLFSQEKFEEMRAVTGAGLATHPHHPWLLNMNGLALINLGRHREAKEQLERAQREAAKLTPEEWGKAYPGNDRRTYAAGLAEFRAAIGENLKLVEEKIINTEGT